MTEKKGGFVKGRYVEELPATVRSTDEPPGPELTAGAPIDPSTPATESTADSAGREGPRPSEDEPGAGASETPIEERLGVASASVTKAVDDVIGAVRTLVGTEEGHRYLETRVERTGEALMGVLRELQGRVDSTIKKK